jgi:hypothetical protein
MPHYRDEPVAYRWSSHDTEHGEESVLIVWFWPDGNLLLEIAVRTGTAGLRRARTHPRAKQLVSQATWHRAAM